MSQFGSNTGMVSQNLSTVVDGQGNQIVSSDNSFGASPLGVAARTQALYGIPNANFNLTPPDVMAVIDTSNPLPYWEISSQGSITATMYYDDARQQWSVNLDPTSAGSGDFVTLKTRSYLLNDSGISLRQKAFATLEKIGTYSSTNQWNLVLTATYFDVTGAQLSTFAIGTVAQNTTWTGINGFTTAGTAIVDSSAAYCDLDFTMTAVATVSGTVTAHLDALLIQTSVASGGGASSFLIAETFLTSTTWTRPAGVDYLNAVILGGGGGGGGGGGLIATRGNPDAAFGGAGGGGGGYLYASDVYVGGADSWTVTIGAGGSGGTSQTFTKAAGSTAISTATWNATAASAGGTTSFGTAYWAGGGGAGAQAVGTTSNETIGGTAGTYQTTHWGVQLLSQIGGSGGNGGGDSTYSGANATATTFVTGTWTTLPYQDAIPYPGSGVAGGTATLTVTGTTGNAVSTAIGTSAAAPTGSGYFFQGAGGGGVAAFVTTVRGGNGGTGISGAGSGGGGIMVYNNSTGTVSGSATWTLTGGSGGNAAGTSGAGGGGGGGVMYYGAGNVNPGTTAVRYTNHTLNLTSGSGGNGGQGYAVIVYVA
jgi:hypothetical protein